MLNYELKRKSLLVIGFNLILLLVAIFIYATREEGLRQIANSLSLIESLSHSHGKFLSDRIKTLLDGDKIYYFWSQWTAKNLIQILLILAIVLGLKEFSEDRQKGSLPLLLNFQTRKDYFRNRILSSWIWIALSVFFQWGLTAALNVWQGLSFDLIKLLFVYFLLLIFLLSFYQIGMLFSFFINGRGVEILIGLGIFLSFSFFTLFCSELFYNLLGYFMIANQKLNFLWLWEGLVLFISLVLGFRFWNRLNIRSD